MIITQINAAHSTDGKLIGIHEAAQPVLSGLRV